MIDAVTTMHDAERDLLQKRTVRTLMISAVPAGLAMSGGFSSAALLGEDLTGSDTLGGLAASCMTLGSALSTVHLARFMGARGRGPGLVAGWTLGVGGSALAFLAAVTGFYPLLPLGMLGLGVGNATNLAQRYASVDLSSEAKRARTLGTMVWAATIGATLGPTIALGGAGNAARAIGLPELAGPYVLSAVLFTVAMWWIRTRLHPDPLAVAGGLTDRRVTRPPVSGTLREIWANPPARLAATGMVVGHAVMVGVMTMTPLHMKDGAHELRIIGFVISVHVIGMYGFSPVVGWFVDKLGARTMIAVGGSILFVGAELAAHTDAEDSLGVFTGLFLIGLGWSFGLVAGSSLLTGSFAIAERVKIQGAGDLLMTGAGAMAGLSAGAIAEWRSYHDLSHWAGMLGLGLSAVAVYALFRGDRFDPQRVASRVDS